MKGRVEMARSKIVDEAAEGQGQLAGHTKAADVDQASNVSDAVTGKGCSEVVKDASTGNTSGVVRQPRPPLHAYCEDCTVSRPSPAACDDELACTLWEVGDRWMPQVPTQHGNSQGWTACVHSGNVFVCNPTQHLYDV